MTIDYAYQCREAALDGAAKASALVPPIQTKLSVTAQTPARGFIREGYAFSPMFTLGMEAEIGEKEALTTWLSLEKAN